MGDKIIYNITELSDAELGACKELLDYLDEDTSDDNIDFLFDMGILSLHQDGRLWYVSYRQENLEGKVIKEGVIRVQDLEIIKMK